MNRKAFQMAMSTLIVILIAIVILAAIIIAVKGGFSDLDSATDPFTDVSTATAIRTSCMDACNNELRITYCCSEYPIDGEEVTCSDSRLDIDCDLECPADFCGE